MAKMSYQAAKYSHQGKQTQTWGGQKKVSENWKLNIVVKDSCEKTHWFSEVIPACLAYLH